MPELELEREGTRRAPQRGAFSAHSLSRDKEWDAAKGIGRGIMQGRILMLQGGEEIQLLGAQVWIASLSLAMTNSC